MDPTTPILSPHNTPPGTEAVTYAKDQPQYRPLEVMRTPDGRVVSAWLPSANELALLANGQPVYLTLYTFNKPLQPILLTVGEPPLT